LGKEKGRKKERKRKKEFLKRTSLLHPTEGEMGSKKSHMNTTSE